MCDPADVTDLPERASTGQHAWLFKQVLALRGITTDSRVLDVGCGSGAWLRRLHEAGFSHLTGIDLQPGPDAAKYGRVVIGDIADTDGDVTIGGHFDLVTVIEVIEHVRDPELLISFAAQRMKSEGWMIVTTPNIYSLRARLRFLINGKLVWFEQPANSEPDHMHPLVLESYSRKIFGRLGLKIERICSYPENGSYGTRWPLRLATQAIATIIADPLPGDSLCLMLRRA
jgi:SAM-dependent methyltransferase